MSNNKKQYVQPAIKEHIITPRQVVCQSYDNVPEKLMEGESYEI